MKFLSTILTILLTLTLASSVALGETRDISDRQKNTQNILGMTVQELEVAVAMGAIPGAYTVNKFGYNAALTGAPEESVWDIDDLPTTADGPLRCFTNITDTPAALYISSDSATDAGLTVTVEYLIADYVAATTTVTLGADTGATGTEFVQIGSVAILRVNRAYAAGASLTGNIYIHKDSVDAAVKDGIPDTVATDMIAGITAGENQSLQACYTVPAGYVALMTSKCVSNLGTGTPAVTFRERKSVEGAASRTQERLSMADELTICKEVSPPTLYAEKTDIEITGSATTQAAGATFGLILIPEDIK
jgi:hypothetical protein